MGDVETLLKALEWMVAPTSLLLHENNVKHVAQHALDVYHGVKKK